MSSKKPYDPDEARRVRMALREGFERRQRKLYPSDASRKRPPAPPVDPVAKKLYPNG